jgi:hypothetical protein
MTRSLNPARPTRSADISAYAAMMPAISSRASLK